MLFFYKNFTTESIVWIRPQRSATPYVCIWILSIFSFNSLLIISITKKEVNFETFTMKILIFVVVDGYGLGKSTR